MANGVPESSTLDLEIEWTWNKQIGFVKSIIQRFFSFFPSLATHPWQLRIRLLGQALGQAMNTYETSKMLRYKIDHVFEGTVPTASNLPRLSIPDTSEVFLKSKHIYYIFKCSHLLTGFKNKCSNQMDQVDFSHNWLSKFECTAFQLSAEVQTLSAEQAQVQVAARELCFL